MPESATSLYSSKMTVKLIIFTLLPVLVACSGEGNINLFTDEVAKAIVACKSPNDFINTKNGGNNERQRRSEKSNDGSAQSSDYMKQENHYSLNNQNLSNHEDLNSFNHTQRYGSVSVVDTDESISTSGILAGNNSATKTSMETRKKRSEPLFTKPDSDQCLSQCVFANLQMVDSRGIPREAELWNKVQSSVTSQQSRSALRDQIRACFQELQSEAEDNGCSYSNKLERCLMLRFADRKVTDQ